jgi:hypothetical protein
MSARTSESFAYVPQRTDADTVGKRLSAERRNPREHFAQDDAE